MVIGECLYLAGGGETREGVSQIHLERGASHPGRIPRVLQFEADESMLSNLEAGPRCKPRCWEVSGLLLVKSRARRGKCPSEFYFDDENGRTSGKGGG